MSECHREKNKMFANDIPIRVVVFQQTCYHRVIRKHKYLKHNLINKTKRFFIKCDHVAAAARGGGDPKTALSL